MLNIVLDNEVILELLAINTNDVQHCYNRLLKSPIRFWIPVAALSLLETQIFPARHRPLATLLENPNVQCLSSLGSHWQQIPAKQSKKAQALVSLDAAKLPGETLIWTNDPNFVNLAPYIEFGDHETIYALLAQYEDEPEFSNLAHQQLNLRNPLENRIFQVLKHGHYMSGPEVKLLEKQLADYLKVKYCVTMASGYDALLLSLVAVGVEAQDEVILSAFAPLSTAYCIGLLGAKPVFVDIESHSYTLDPTLLAAAITSRTKAIVVTNCYGQCADFTTLNPIAAAHQLPIIEDARSSFGATHQQQRSGRLATLSCCSFAPDKPLGAYSKAGACFTDEEKLANRLQALCCHGQLDSGSHHALKGKNSQLDSLQAGILLAKLSLFPKEVNLRMKIGELYTQLLQGKVTTPQIATQNTHVFHRYTVEVENRTQVREKLHKLGITTHVDYPVPLPLQPIFQSLGAQWGQFPVAEAASQRVLNLPMHPALTKPLIQQVARKLLLAMKN